MIESSRVDKVGYSIYIVNNVLYLEYTTEIVTEEIALRLIKDKLKLVKDNKYKSVILMNKVKHIDGKTRRLLNTPAANEGIIKCAVLINSKIQEVVTNFFTIINRPKVPVRVFTKREDAEKWIGILCKK